MTELKAEERKREPKSKQGGFMSKFILTIFSFILILSLMWNWDGFWQTDIKPLKDMQKSLFSVKYKEEQLKLSRIAHNNEIIEEYERRLEIQERKANKSLDKAGLAMEKALADATGAEKALEDYLDKETQKCRYYDVSLRMIRLLTKKYSQYELSNVVSCTNKECEEILRGDDTLHSLCSEF